MNTTEQSRHTSEKPTGDSSNQGAKANPLDCNICYEDSFEPVVTPCGHIYCWGCIYKWLQAKEQNNYCPVCNAVFTKEKLIPIYSKNEKPGSRKHDESIPKRPKPEREERPRNENGTQGQNPRDFFNGIHFGGFGFGNMMFSGINFRTQNMSMHVAVVPILISVFFSLFMNLFGTSSDYSYPHPSASQHQYQSQQQHQQQYQQRASSYGSRQASVVEGGSGLDLNIILLIVFLCLGFFIKKIMR